LSDYLGNKGLDINMLKGYCQSGKAVFLFDGLDEMEPGIRELTVNSLADFRINYNKCKMVFSGRPHGMDNTVINRFGKGLVKISSLKIEQVENFIRKWFAFIYAKGTETGKKTANEMIGEIKSHRRIKELIDSPLMLTAVCILYYDGRKLPEQRAELYNKFVDNLIFRRFDGPEKVKDLLMTTAFKVHKKKERGFDRVFALKIMTDIYPKEKEESDKPYRQRIEEKFNEIEQNCGLLRLEKGQYEFWHLTIQEFFTAVYITDYAKTIEAYWDNDWYNEVIELYIGYLSMQSKGQANNIVMKELRKDEESPFRRLRLAANSLLDIHEDRRDKTVLQEAGNKMLSIISSGEDPKVLAEAGEILGRLGDTRNLEEFIEIKGGKYKLETIGTISLKPFEITIDTISLKPFEIGRYPVTNQWFEKFIKDGGYKNPKYWSEEGKKWLEDEKITHPRFWHDRKWNCPNSPVVGVCWYEADAFCKWLTQTRKDSHIYRLPSEEEWQAAAVGKDGREYPWKGKWQEKMCNTSETEIHKTSSVGIFIKGNTPNTDLADMAGNVWEWTCSDYKTKKQLKDFILNLSREKAQQNPALRGGSFIGFKDGVRCVSRTFYYPDYRGYDFGFRCARTPVK
jgi:formylglycine-generating enzyme required for sulfatase activity